MSLPLDEGSIEINWCRLCIAMMPGGTTQKWLGQKASNPQPSESKSDALPIELYPNNSAAEDLA